ncbi:MAG TPA: hypothetical protein EYG92_12545, partial [Lutibacter sp.]|nr:hypothetical protein [Lutibacter sp.]
KQIRQKEELIALEKIEKEQEIKRQKEAIALEEKRIQDEQQARIVAAQEIAKQLKLEEEAKLESIRQDKIEEAKIAQAEKENQIRKEEELIALEKIQQEQKIEKQKAAIALEQKRIQDEKNARIVAAQEIANQLKLEENAKLERIRLEKIKEAKIALAEKEEQKRKEGELIALEKIQQEQEKILDENNKRIAKAQETAKQLKLEEDAKFERIRLEEIEAMKIAQAEKENKIRKEEELIALEKIQQEQALIDNNIDETNKNSVTNITDTSEIPESIGEKQTERCSENIFGIIQNSKDNSPITEANVDIYFDGQNIETVRTNDKGEFFIYNVDCETDYTLICFKKDFKNIAKAAINTTSLPDQIILLLEPNKEEIPETIVILEKPKKDKEEIRIIPTEVEEASLIENLAESSQIENSPKSTITDSKSEIIQTIESTEVLEDEEKILEPKVIEKRPDYIPDIESPKIKGKNILLNPIFFELDEWYLTLSARRELDKIIVLMYLNKTMIIESGSHTDSRGPNAYNLELSEKRSQEAVGYLVANGVDPDRISGRGYGETMPVNNCVDGVKCSDKEHLRNRRTEFIILKR